MSEAFSYSRPAGCPDASGAAPRRARRLEETLLRRMGDYGFELVDLPVLEHTDLFSPDTLGHDLFHRLITARVSDSAVFPLEGPSGPGYGGGESYRTSEVALRPELTAQVSRWLVGELLAGEGEGRLSPALPARLAYAGTVFRDVEPVPGERREFRQVGAELVGGDPSWGDREILALAADCAAALGLESWEIRLSHTGLYRAILEGFGLEGARLEGVARHLENASRLAWEARQDDETLLAFLRDFARTHRGCFPAELSELDRPEALEADPWRARMPALYEAYLRELWTGSEHGLDADAVDRLLALGRLSGTTDEIHRELSAYPATDEARLRFEELEALCFDLHHLRGRTPIVTAASRGLAYYTGMTFEIHAAAGGNGRGGRGGRRVQVCGGGRYDRLHGRVYRRALETARLRRPGVEGSFEGSEDLLTGVGCAFRLDRVAAALGPAAGEGRRGAVDVLVAAFEPSAHGAAFRLAEELRGAGVSARCQLPPPGQALTPETQRGEAERLGARVYAACRPGGAGQGAASLELVRLDAGKADARSVPAAEAAREILLLLQRES